MFTTVFALTDSLSVTNVLLCTLVSLALGFMIALIHMREGTHTKSFVVTLVLLPALVQFVIMMVNGNLGVGVAVLGAFSLVRFRSAPGTSREITAIFFAMAVGLAAGMGYLTFAAVAGVLLGAVLLILNYTHFGSRCAQDRMLRVTIPEDLDYTEVFEDIFAQYTTKNTLERVKTTNLGSLYELTYRLTLKESNKEKAFIDELRCRNGNLTIVCGRSGLTQETLEL